jgi:hypothetical protein
MAPKQAIKAAWKAGTKRSGTGNQWGIKEIGKREEMRWERAENEARK